MKKFDVFYRGSFAGIGILAAAIFTGACASDSGSGDISSPSQNRKSSVSPKVAGAVSDAMHFPCEDGSVKFSGVLGGELDASMKGDMLSWDVDDLVRPFKTRPENKLWQIEFWGKWFTSAALAYSYEPSGQLDKILKYAASELLKTQAADGSITTYKKGAEFSGWDIWGRKYVLLGLLAEYARTGDAGVLDAAKKHADNIMASVGEGKKIGNICEIGMWQGMASSSLLEPMVLLYKYTGDKKYLDYSEWIVSCWAKDNPKPDLVSKALAGTYVVDMFAKPKKGAKEYMDGGLSKSYEMMSCYEGLLELYRITGNEKYKRAAVNAAKAIAEREITVLGSGSIWERWTDGKFCQQEDSEHWMETCVSATWIKFCAQLLRLTGDPSYADGIELAAYNALAAAQRADGKWWAHYSRMKGVRTPAPEQSGMHMNCCVASGPRALFLLPKIAYMSGRGNSVYVNLYENGFGKVGVPSVDGKVTLKVSGVDFGAQKLRAKILLEMPGGLHTFSVCLRIPSWSKKTEISVNGQKAASPDAGIYAVLKRDWKSGDEIEIEFDSRAFVERDPSNPSLVAVRRGPYVYALDRRYNPSFDKPFKPALDGNDFLKSAVPVKVDGAASALKVGGIDGKSRIFVDYPSAGSTWGKDSEFRVWQ